MKLAWLVWRYEEDDYPIMMPDEPEWCYKRVQIVFQEVSSNWKLNRL